MTAITLIAGLVGGSWITRWLDHPQPISNIALPSRRRRLGIVLELEIVDPEGHVWSPRLQALTGAAALDTLAIQERQLALRVADTRGAPLRIVATAPQQGSLAAFSETVSEGHAALWRLPLRHGLATIRARLQRDVVDC